LEGVVVILDLVLLGLEIVLEFDFDGVDIVRLLVRAGAWLLLLLDEGLACILADCVRVFWLLLPVCNFALLRCGMALGLEYSWLDLAFLYSGAWYVFGLE